MTAGLIVDPYSGPGGWSQGLRALGRTDIGIELDPAACATRAAAGHLTIRADVARMPLESLAGRVEGLIASPPCPMFSTAGKGAGREVMAELTEAIVDALAGRPRLAAHTRTMARKLRASYLARDGWETRAGAAAQAWHDARQAAHTVQPARWIAATNPRWVALEQVPAVLPLWETYARLLRAMGYSTWAGILNAADYGVPQTRRRAILMASRTRTVGPPTATHAKGGAVTLFGELTPWVSMADALDWPDTWEVKLQRGTGLIERHGDRPATPATAPAPTIRAGSKGSGPNLVVLRAGAQSNATVRSADEPAPTVLASWDNGDTQWVVRTGANSMVTSRTGSRAGDGGVQPYERPVTEPAPTLDSKTGAWRLHTNRGQEPDGTRQTVPSSAPAPALTAKAGGQWAFRLPATTIAGDPRITARCHHDEGKQGADAKTTAQVQAGDYEGTEPIKLTLAEALILQSFPPGYPVQGTKTKQFEQVGNAVPPLLAAHILATLTGHTLEPAA